MKIFETTYNQLFSNIERGFDTKKRQHISDTVNILKVYFTPFKDNNSLLVRSEAKSQGSSTYHPSIQFSNVEFTEDSEQNNAVSFMGNSVEEHIIPIKLNNNDVKVGCDCMDFKFRFSMWNHNDGSHYGEKPDPYVKKTDRPPANPDRVPGVCKHVVRLMDRLQQLGIVK